MFVSILYRFTHSFTADTLNSITLLYKQAMVRHYFHFKLSRTDDSPYSSVDISDIYRIAATLSIVKRINVVMASVRKSLHEYHASQFPMTVRYQDRRQVRVVLDKERQGQLPVRQIDVNASG